MSRIQNKRGTAANLASVNPTPLAGELVFVSDENAIKIGDGSTAWSSLAYVTATPRSHKSTHATGGSDALSPSDIGAAALSGATFTGAVEFDSTVANSVAAAVVVDGNFETTSNAEVVTKGVFSDVRKTVSSGVTDSGKLFGGQFDAIADGAGTLADAYGVYARAVNLGDGTLTTATAIYAHVIGGTTGYGVYIAAGSATTSWGVYQAGTEKNYFGGNVGIGVSPTSALHVNGTVDCDGLIVGTTTASATGISLLGAADAAAGRTTLGAAPAASPAITGNATFEASSGVPVTITNTGTGNSFVVNDAAGDTTPFVVDASGKVAIGSSAGHASRGLLIKGADFSSGSILLQSSATPAGNDVGFLLLCGNNLSYVWNYESNPILFGTGNAERMRLTAAGDLGLGPSRTAPASRLDVNGVITVSATSGSAGSYLPSVTFSGDANTGFGQVSGQSDTASIFTAGHERLRVDSSGNIRVGGVTSNSGVNIIAPNASGTDQAGGTLVIGGTQSTGTGAGGSISFATAGAGGASGSSLNGRVTRLEIKSSGVVRFHPLSADPASGEAGDVYYNSSTNKLRVYNGTSWVDLH